MAVMLTIIHCALLNIRERAIYVYFNVALEQPATAAAAAAAPAITTKKRAFLCGYL
jgi:hypothetical protein